MTIQTEAAYGTQTIETKAAAPAHTTRPHWCLDPSHEHPGTFTEPAWWEQLPAHLVRDNDLFCLFPEGMPTHDLVPSVQWPPVPDGRWAEPPLTAPDPDLAMEVVKLERKAEAAAVYAERNSVFGSFDPAAVLAADAFFDDDQIMTPFVEGVLEADSLAAIIGEYYSGKSYVALDLACSIATGTDWHGHATRQGKVLYLAMEGKATIRPRVDAWKRHHGLDTVDGLHVMAQVVNLFDRASVARLAGFVRSERFDVVVIDTLSRSFGGQNENAPEAMTQYVNALDELRQATPDTSVVVVHHPSKANPTEPRGHSSFAGALDTLWVLSSPERAGDEYRTLTSSKWKAATPRLDIGMAFRTVDGSDSSVLVPARASSGSPTTQLLARMIEEYGTVTRSMLKAQLVGSGVYASENSATNAITGLVRSGAVLASSNRGDGVLTLAP